MFEWKDSYSVGIEEIDKQHENLLGIGEELVYVMENTTKGLDQYDEIKRLLKELYDYTVYHFTAEEKLMKKYDFIDLPSHQFQHKLFVKKIEEIDLDEFDNDQIDSTFKIMEFLSNWITNHILKIDPQYSKVLREKGVR
ncbi:bacteriohemerythrin [Halocella sp. SP3-1]|uniref:bacteriohemerythrin n=1 Tax=Halocella sp. SP3-1 TaxID=2382161 RepID=UPI000F759605|nr:bacteriohemerythrin [Halocella sp. SP3-1]AZO96198.1 bacteriohemerythrin [Halocella sp. SP3-1]